MVKNILSSVFLISRSKKHDYKIIVAPEFLVRSRSSSILTKAVSLEELSGWDTVIYRSILIDIPSIKEVTLFFRVRRATMRDIGYDQDENADDELFDLYSRRIKFIEGSVYKGIIDEDEAKNFVPNFEIISESVIPHYKEFWQDDKYKTYSSQPQKLTHTSGEFDSNNNLNLKSRKVLDLRKSSNSSPPINYIARTKPVNQNNITLINNSLPLLRPHIAIPFLLLIALLLGMISCFDSIKVVLDRNFFF